MLVDYTGPGADGKEGEVLHRFIGEVLDECEVIVHSPDIDGDKSYYRIRKKMPSGKTREVLLQGWDLESLEEDGILEKHDLAEKIVEEMVSNPDKWNMAEAIETYSFYKDISDRISKANADLNHVVGERYRKIMASRIIDKVERMWENGKGSDSK